MQNTQETNPFVDAGNFVARKTSEYSEYIFSHDVSTEDMPGEDVCLADDM